ncbi:MAG TPA: hypothetical protein VHP99_15655 [Pyrinomonadaceae bacterium]|nr:hypothetical protein [Pyrinomonadaceae bacterium]
MKCTIALLLVTLAAFSVAGKVPTVPQADAVEPIRQHYANINQNMARYRRVKKNLAGFSAEGGELVAYFHGPSVMKMVATFFGESGRAVEEYYFWNGQLIFVFHTDNHYDKPLSGKVARKIESRFYFKDDKLIRWLDENGKEVATDSAEYGPKQVDYLKMSKQFVDGVKSKATTIESP